MGNRWWRNRSRDWLAYYNGLLEKQGESTEIGTVHFRPADGGHHLTRYNHTQCDGFGALVDGLKKLGYREDELPAPRPRKPPKFFTLLAALLRFLKNEFQPVRALPWRNPKPRPPFAAVGPAIHYFTPEETNLLTRAAKRGGVHPSHLLMRALARATREIWLQADTLTRWHVPVSIRGRQPGAETLKNCLTNFVMEVRPADTPADLQKTQFRQLKAGDPFATWVFLNLGNLPGLGKTLDGKVRADYKNPRPSERITGTFSSIGPWPLAGAPDHLPGEVVIPYGNVSLKNPICLVNLVWRGHLAFSLQAHSSICQDPGEVELAVAQIVAELRSQLHEGRP